MYPPHSFGGLRAWSGESAVEHLRERGHDVARAHDRHGHGRDRARPAARPPRAALAPARRRVRRRSARARPVALARHNHRVLERHLAELEPDVVTWWSMGGLTLTLLEAVRRRGLPARRVRARRLARLRAAASTRGCARSPARGAAGSRLGRAARRHPGAGRLRRAPRVRLRQRAHAPARGARPRARPGRTGVAHSGIDPAFLDPAPEREWGWRLLYVGRLDARKGVHTASRRSRTCPPRRGSTSSAAGTTREEERLRGLAARASGVADRVRFLGPPRPRRAHRRLRRVRRVRLPGRLGGAVGARAARGDGARAARRRDRARRVGRVPARRRELPAVRGRATRARSPRRSAGWPTTRSCGRGCARAGSQTAPRHTEAVLNAAVEGELATSWSGRACGSVRQIAKFLRRLHMQPMTIFYYLSPLYMSSLRNHYSPFHNPHFHIHFLKHTLLPPPLPPHTPPPPTLTPLPLLPSPPHSLPSLSLSHSPLSLLSLSLLSLHSLSPLSSSLHLLSPLSLLPSSLLLLLSPLFLHFHPPSLSPLYHFSPLLI